VLPKGCENGDPIQLGFLVGQDPAIDRNATQLAEKEVADLRVTRGMKILGTPTVTTLKLADGTPAALVDVELARIIHEPEALTA
jgi:hypothetical protein